MRACLVLSSHTVVLSGKGWSHMSPNQLGLRRESIKVMENQMGRLHGSHLMKQAACRSVHNCFGQGLPLHGQHFVSAHIDPRRMYVVSEDSGPYRESRSLSAKPQCLTQPSATHPKPFLGIRTPLMEQLVS